MRAEQIRFAKSIAPGSLRRRRGQSEKFGGDTL